MKKTPTRFEREFDTTMQLMKAFDDINRLEAELSQERSLSLRYRQKGVDLEAELATERARLDWLITSSDEGKSDYLSDSLWDDASKFFFEEKTTAECVRAAIDAAMKESK